MSAAVGDRERAGVPARGVVNCSSRLPACNASFVYTACLPLALTASHSSPLGPRCRRHVAALHHANIDTLEHIGGGGVRCTLAEIF